MNYTVKKEMGRIENVDGFRDRPNTAKSFNNEVKTFFPFIGLRVFGRTHQKPLNGLRCQMSVFANS